MELTLDGAVNYHYDKFPPNDLKYQEFIQPLLKATDAIARYDQMLKNMRNSEIFLTPLRNQEAVISSRMEGTISTMDEILKYEADYDSETKNDRNVRMEIIETLLYQRALKSAQQSIEQGRPIFQSLLKATHQRLLSYGRGASKSPGMFKNEQNYIADRLRGTVFFVPINPVKLQDGIDNLFDYIKNSTDPPLIKTALSHIEFEALHPFQDGNGRIGRMLITMMLWSSGTISAPHFYISAYLEKNKDLYMDTMRKVSQYDAWENWCAFFLTAVEQQAIQNLTISEKIQSLYEDMKAIFSESLSSKWCVNALDFVFTYPVFRNNKFTTNSGIPTPTAARFTRVLLEKGLITTLEEASGRRAALYSFEPLMRLLRV